jgi:hypothetical protein
MGRCELDSYDKGQGLVAGPCENSGEHFGFKKGRVFFD